ncbi:MAG: methyltransferase domain-containing protein [Euryarchaeota archaeon]|nr:methyltransferase domain-containing protein [Euryarchaeota archaeon]
MRWDPAVYERFRSERERPFRDLVAALPQRPYRRIVDAGCGTGRTTRTLAERFPAATVTGVDASAEMLQDVDPALRLVQADIRVWRPSEPVDLVVANAVLHWLPGPEETLRHLAGWLDDDGALAFQVPANHEEPSHRIVREVASEGGWADRLREAEWGDHVLSLYGYARALRSEGLEVEAWETRYLHMLEGEDAVLEWLLGTTLRPVAALLSVEEMARFVAALRPRLREAYPLEAGKVAFPFLRRFGVASHGRTRS